MAHPILFFQNNALLFLLMAAFGTAAQNVIAVQSRLASIGTQKPHATESATAVSALHFAKKVGVYYESGNTS